MFMEVLAYETETGKCQVDEFLSQLPPKLYAKSLWTIRLLEANGPKLREPFSKHLGNGIFELRIQQGNTIVRVLYFFFKGNQAILTNGFVKKAQATPRAQIVLAERSRNDFERRVKHENF